MGGEGGGGATLTSMLDEGTGTSTFGEGAGTSMWVMGQGRHLHGVGQGYQPLLWKQGHQCRVRVRDTNTV